jgi:hypothetical protein
MSTYIDLDSVWRDRSAYPNPCDYSLTADQVATWSKSVREVRALPQIASERPLDFVAALNLLGATLPYPRVELFATTFIDVDSITGGNTFNTLTPDNLAVGDVVITSSPGFAISNGVGREVEYHVVNILSPTSFQVSLLPGGLVQSFTNGTGLEMMLAVLGDPADPASDYASVTAQTAAAKQLITFPRIYLDVHTHRYNDPRCIRTIGGVLADAKFILVMDKVQYTDDLQPIWLHYRSHGEQVVRFKRDDPVTLRFMTRDGTTIPFFVETDLAIPTNPYKQTMISINNTPYLRDAIYSNHQVDPIQ